MSGATFDLLCSICDIGDEMPPVEADGKERGKEKGKSPHTPLKEKEIQKEISAPVPVPRAGARTRGEPSGAGSGSVGFRLSGIGAGSASPARRRKANLAELILGGILPDGRRSDPVQVAMLVLRLPAISEDARGVRYDNARILRWCVKRIGEELFRELLYQQWRENAIDGEPRSRAAAFMAKLNRAVYGTRAKRGAR